MNILNIVIEVLKILLFTSMCLTFMETFYLSFQYFALVFFNMSNRTTIRTIGQFDLSNAISLFMSLIVCSLSFLIALAMLNNII